MCFLYRYAYLLWQRIFVYIYIKLFASLKKVRLLILFFFSCYYYCYYYFYYILLYNTFFFIVKFCFYTKYWLHHSRTQILISLFFFFDTFSVFFVKTKKKFHLYELRFHIRLSVIEA